jgi:poly-gamma-glutamate capsule biosynthesis protein CapA/YwtB (metallophosphatase superfamily)
MDAPEPAHRVRSAPPRRETRRMKPAHTRLFLAGDIMPGRGIDQILRHRVASFLFEPWVRDARTYVELAEQLNGRIPRGATPAYVWGAALAILAARQPAARIVNLETSITTSDQHWPDKSIHYRMHPANVDLLTAAGLDCCVLANNHVLDWGYPGLVETLATLEAAGIAQAGAGHDAAAAARPARLALAAGRHLHVRAFAVPSSGVPSAWAASEHHAGIQRLDDLSAKSARNIAGALRARCADGDYVLVSLHWGGNWGYEIPPRHRDFARALVEHGVDVVHGHSSHHPLGIEVHAGRLILYGCGDLLNDYEGIGGHESYRCDLALMYFADLAADGRLAALEMVPVTVRRFAIERADAAGAAWLAAMLAREGRPLGTRVTMTAAGTLALASGQIEAIRVHHLGPGRDEVLHELFPVVVLRIDLGVGAQDRVRAEHQIDPGRRPLDLAGARSRTSYRPLPAGFHS